MPNEVSPLPHHVIVAYNEASTNHRRVLRQARELDKIVPVRLVYTHPEYHLTAEALHEEVGDADDGEVEVLSGGGDGTALDVYNALPGRKITPLRGGNANDFARSLNGNKTALQIMLEGRDALFRPMEVTTRTPGSDGIEKTRIVLGYFGIGADAAASQRLNEIKNTSNPVTRAIGFQAARELIASTSTMARYPGYKIVHGEGKDESTTFITDEMGLYIPIIAKHGRTGVDLWKPEMKVVTTIRRGLKQTLQSMYLLQQGKLEGRMVTEMSRKLRSSDESGVVPLQCNGEVEWLPDDTLITARISDMAYLTRSTLVPHDDDYPLAA